MDRAGPRAKELQQRVDALSERFREAKARNDEPEMQRIAQERREARKALYPILSETRKQHRQELIERFYQRIGNHSRCDTYRVRFQAVQEGLGFATANRVLESALKAWSDSMKQGRAPRFAVGAQKTQDVLTIQFTNAGGVLASDLFGKRKEVALDFPKKGFRKRSYAGFRYRLGAASEGCYAEGSVQLDRPFPEGARVALARLVRKKVGMKHQYELQFLLTLPEPVRIEVPTRRKPLLALHFGWSFDENGRRLAGVCDNGDALGASLLHLPPAIESMLRASAQVQAERDESRDAIVPKLKALSLPELPEGDALAAVMDKVRNSPAQHVSANRLHHILHLLRERDIPVPDDLVAWGKEDRMRWQKQVGLARRARNRRRNFYRQCALDWARQYETILMEVPDLKKAAMKLDEQTGEKTDLAKKARAGRTLAALYELESAIQWAACKAGAAVLRLSGEPTASVCSLCGGASLQEDEQDSQVQYCPDCGSTLDRKTNGAANAWKAAHADLETLVTDYWKATLQMAHDAEARKAKKLARMVEGRKAARAVRSSCAA
jgi:hypothetical protein